MWLLALPGDRRQSLLFLVPSRLHQTIESSWLSGSLDESPIAMLYGVSATHEWAGPLSQKAAIGDLRVLRSVVQGTKTLGDVAQELSNANCCEDPET